MTFWTNGPDATFSGGAYRSGNDNAGSAAVTWSGDQLDQVGNGARTFECKATVLQVPNSTGTILMRYVNDQQQFIVSCYSDAALIQVTNVNSGGGTDVYRGESMLPKGETHLALVVPAGASPTARFYVGGLLAWSGTVSNLDGGSATFSIGPSSWQGPRDIRIRNVRVQRIEAYKGENVSHPDPLPPPDWDYYYAPNADGSWGVVGAIRQSGRTIFGFGRSPTGTTRIGARRIP